ncbi:MAG: insulinase family protein, partial [Betaproteobacteria bacterium]|nr:insulinase family protein [Betaproteobacteria bacterium]
PLFALAHAAPLALPQGVTAVRQIEGVAEYRLANGLQVLLLPDDSKPSTTVNLTVHVGSRFENYGETGMAHLLEHLMFKGSPRHPQPWADFTQRGLRANGSTTTDRTNYFASFSANDGTLTWYLGWLADALVNSNIARKDLDSEMTVVRNEMEMDENNPQRILMEKVDSAAYQWHAYGKSTIGARADVENVSIPRLQAFYREYYQPDNATLIVTGRFAPQAVLDTVAAAFGVIPKPTRVLPRFYTLDPAQEGERSVVLRRANGTPEALVAYHVPAMADPQYPAIDLSAFMLGDTPSGRLYKALVQTKLAAQVWGYAWDRHDPTLAYFGAELAPGQDPHKAAEVVAATVEGVAQQPFTAEELKRAKTQWLNQWDQQFNDPERVGSALSEAVANGDWRLMFLQRDRVQAMTLPVLQQVAAQYFVRDNRTTGLFIPGDPSARPPAPRFADIEGELKGYKGRAAVAQAEAFEATPANIDARTQRFSLANGMKVALLPKGTRGNTVVAQAVLDFGDATTTFGQTEAGRAMAALLDKGTPQMTRAQIADRFDQLQATVGFSGGPTSLTVGMQTTRDNLPAVLDLVGQLLRNASFPADALDEYKRSVLAGLAAQRKDPEVVAALAIGRHDNPYPRGDVRYYRSFDEKQQDIQALTLEQVKAFHARFLGADHGRFAAVGAMDAQAVRRALDAAFGTLVSKVPYARVPTPLVKATPATLTLLTPDQQNATMIVDAALPVQEGSPDYAALTMAVQLLGGGGDSRLWKRIREKEGLSYSVYSYIGWNSFEPNSDFGAAAIFAPQNRAKVDAAFKDELARALSGGFTQAELDAARQGMLNSRKLARAQDSALVNGWLHDLDIGQTFAYNQKIDDEIAALTLAQVNDALRKYIDPRSFVTAFAGDFKAAPPQ